jgi:UDP-N-acetylglucosamine 2-epimerase (non-hydrolysing)
MLVAGARPNFMKIASIIDAIKMHNVSIENSTFDIQHLLVHTGQHYDNSMSEAFFRDLELPRPDIHLEVGSASHSVQTAEIMKRFEPVLLEHKPDFVIVVGDVNSTVACALVASKIQYDSSTESSKLKTHNSGVHRPLIAHVEAGLRSFDRTMPEEINRLLTDAIADFLFTTEESANENLKREGIPKEKIHFVGNTMIDTLLKHREKAQQSKILEKLGLINLQLKTENSNLIPYGVLTLHRPSNVDNKETFRNILEALKEVAKHLRLIFPAHPRTLNRVKEFNFEDYFNFNSVLSTQPPHIYCVDPLGYLDFLCLMSNSKLVLTDSGGMQEETAVLGIPCITMRKNTERPVTINFGTNILAGVQKEKIISAALSQLKKHDSRSPNTMINTQHSTLSTQHSFSPPLWDGKAGERIINILTNHFIKQS